MTLSTSAVAASRRYASANERFRAAVLASRLADAPGLAVLFNSRACAPRFLAGAADDASLRSARVFAFVTAERVRAPRLGPFALDSPRLIYCRPDGQCGSNANLAHLFATAHGSQCDLRHTHLQDNLNPIGRVYYGAHPLCVRVSLARNGPAP